MGPMLERASELLKAWRAEWLHPIDTLIMSGSIKQPMDCRGFVESIELAAEVFPGRFGDIVSLEPIRFLTLSEVGHCPSDVFASSDLERIRALNRPRNKLVHPSE